MTKTEFERRVAANISSTKSALQLVWDNLNNGQQKKLLKEAEVKELLERYGVIEPS